MTDGQKWNVVHDNESIYEDQQGKAGSAGRDKLGAGPRSGKSSVIPIGAVDVDKNSFKRSATVYLVACTQNAYHECYFLQLSSQSIGDDAPLRCHPSVHRTEHPTSRKPRMPMEPSPLVWALFGRMVRCGNSEWDTDSAVLTVHLSNHHTQRALGAGLVGLDFVRRVRSEGQLQSPLDGA